MKIVETWFGGAFSQLHPKLQQLHREGGVLRGKVDVSFGAGVAGAIGRRLARKLGVPTAAGAHHLEVTIFSDNGVLHWNRRFDAGTQFHSEFRPYGRFPSGGWIERTHRRASR